MFKTIVGLVVFVIFSCVSAAGGDLYFPPAGKGMENQARRSPQQVGLDPDLAGRVNRYITEHPYIQRRVQPRWALWRHGYLVHVEGDFQKTTDVASLRKTWHAMIVGAAIKQGKIPSYREKISRWLPELKGRDAEATWWHVMTQSAGFDYPYGDYPDFKPGQMWTYSDWNLVHLCNALARVYGKKDFSDHYADVAAAAYFDAIGMEGWSTRIVKDGGFGSRPDGVRFVLSLEHMGRLGLLVLARGSWDGKELVPKWFVEELETKQTYGMRVNYNGPNDGKIGMSPEAFPECPYGYLTWVNTDGDLFAGADHGWACGRGAGGSVVLWNRKNGVVFAGFGIQVRDEGVPPSNRGQDARDTTQSIARVIESSITGSNPLAGG
jgi:CubicO group peptidase (beta-lactamase class C family)